MEREDMPAEVTKKLFTVDDYYRMAEVGILKPEDRVELLEGEIVEMSPIGNRHAGCVNRVNDLFTFLFRGKAIVTVQNPARLNQYNEPQPDFVLAKTRTDYYASRHPTGEDIYLMVEVADSSLRKDRDIKVPIYARLGVPEVWIVDLQRDRILIFRDPVGNSYKTTLTLHRGESLSVLAFPEITFNVEEVLG
jgi:Uma2 family endonuclease